MIAHFFKGDDSLKGRVPTGIHGPQIPEAMVALAATLVSTVCISFQTIAKALRLVD